MKFIGRVAIKAGLLFVLFNALFAVLNPLPLLAQLSVYNSLVAGRSRLPYAENPAESYSLTPSRLDFMLAAHELTGSPKAKDEYRVILIGDSSVWGWLLEPDQTLSACLNRENLRLPDGRRLYIYNLGYPILDVTKDALILQEVLPYEPDLVVWLVTLEALYPQYQLDFDIVRDHASAVRGLIKTYDLKLDPTVLPAEPNFWGRSIIGQRRVLADWLRLQIYGLAWAETGVDHRDPVFSIRVRQNLQTDANLLDGTPEQLWDREDLAFDVIQAGQHMAAEAGSAMLLINQPIFRSEGQNSDLRYNYFYPRWAYDRYRKLLGELAADKQWHYADLWDSIPSDQFTDTPFHLTPPATCDLAVRIGAEILALDG